MKRTILLIFFISLVFADYVYKADPTYSFAILSDTHIGDSGADAVSKLQTTVAKINSLVSEKNIKYVFLTGDVTNTALPEQYATARKLLDSLTVPYIPSIGNHDQWSYNSTWEEVHPTGDALFAKTFADKFQQEGVTFYNNQTCYNSEENIISWFQNWEFRYGNLLFLSLDWNSREPAVAELGYKGSMPGAQLHNYKGGTLPCLGERLSVVPQEVDQIVLLQHHPFRSPWYIPGFIYSFSEEQDDQVRAEIEKYQPVDRFWGVFAGHFHMWSNGTAFDEWPSFIQWETSATKVDYAFTLVTVQNDKIYSTEKMYGNQ